MKRRGTKKENGKANFGKGKTSTFGKVEILQFVGGELFQPLETSQENPQNDILAFGSAKENYDYVGGMRTTLQIATVGSLFGIL